MFHTFFVSFAWHTRLHPKWDRNRISIWIKDEPHIVVLADLVFVSKRATAQWDVHVSWILTSPHPSIPLYPPTNFSELLTIVALCSLSAVLVVSPALFVEMLEIIDFPLLSLSRTDRSATWGRLWLLMPTFVSLIFTESSWCIRF